MATELLLIALALLEQVIGAVPPMYQPTRVNSVDGHSGYGNNLSHFRRAAMNIRRAAAHNSLPSITPTEIPSSGAANNGGVPFEDYFVGPDETTVARPKLNNGLMREEQRGEGSTGDGSGMNGTIQQRETKSEKAKHVQNAELAQLAPAGQQQQQPIGSQDAHFAVSPDSAPRHPAKSGGPPLPSTIPNLCSDDETPTFLRHQWLPMDSAEGGGGPTLTPANFVRKMDSLDACARLCRDNVEPFGGRHFGCHGFTYVGQRNSRNACEFFDDHLAAVFEKKPPLGAHRDHPGPGGSSAPQFHKNYFERICLNLPPHCARLPFAFEVHPRRALAIPRDAKKLLREEQVDDRKRCLQQCLSTKGCRSLDFDTVNLTCTLYTHSQHSILGAREESSGHHGGELVESADVDHYENTCLTDLDRCGPRHLAFVLIRNAELGGFSVGLGPVPVSDCLGRCLDSPPAFCRSVQLRSVPDNANVQECFLATERPFWPIPSDEMDIYEPICLPDPPQTSTLECLGEHVFERVPNMELRMDEEEEDGSPVPNEGRNGTELAGLTLERCLDACILDESCVSLIFRPSSPDPQHNNNNLLPSNSKCQLLPFSRMDNRTLSVIHPNADYYELSCNRIPIPSSARTISETGQEETGPGRVTVVSNDERVVDLTPLEPAYSTVPFSSSASTSTPESTSFGVSGVSTPSVSLAPTPTTSVPQSSPSTLAISTPSGPSSTSCSLMDNSILLARGRTLRLEQRQQHHVNVRDSAQCARLCANAKAIRCRSFAYSPRSRDCLLTASVVEGRESAEDVLLTQANPNFELYKFVGGGHCEGEGRTTVAQLIGSERKSTAATGTTVHTMTWTSSSSADQFRTHPIVPTDGTTAMDDHHLRPTTSVGTIFTSAVSEPPLPEPSITDHDQPIAVQVPNLAPEDIDDPTTPMMVVGGTVGQRNGPQLITPTLINDQFGTTAPIGPWMSPTAPSGQGHPSSSASSHHLPSSSFLNTNSLPSSYDGRLRADQIRAGVICDAQGLNVTFWVIEGEFIHQRYTGVIYAADRFAHCRLFVEDASEFAFYVNRPANGQTNWCNSVEMNDELNVVLVLSNDGILPLDVTTKDDLFFHVSCDYRAQHHGKIAWPGSISGPEPGPSFSAAARRPNKPSNQRRPLAEPELDQQRRGRVRLKILRDGRPVNSVYIGERLKAVVESTDLEVDRLRVGDCNATRVGGRVPQPNSIALLDRSGCSLNPHIIGHMQRHGSRLEAPLSAFRIDGSDQIDIVCTVLVCRARCTREPEHCDDLPNGRAKKAVGKQSLLLNSVVPLPLSDPEHSREEEDMLKVDQRIRVLLSEEEAETDAELAEDRHNNHNALLGVGDVITVEEDKRAAEQGKGADMVEELLGGMATAGASGYICLNSLALLALLVLLLLSLASLLVSLLAHWCRRKGSRHQNFYPASTFSTELSSHHFHIPRIHDRTSYMG